MYKRAIAADPYNSKILNQFDSYKSIRHHLQEVNTTLSSLLEIGCILCNGTTLCPFCQLKSDFRNELPIAESSMSGRTDVLDQKRMHYLEDVINALLTVDESK